MRYESNFKSHYHISPNNFWKSFIYFLGGQNNTYRKAIKTIRERKNHEALALDIENLTNDCATIIISNKLQNKKHLVDACQ